MLFNFVTQCLPVSTCYNLLLLAISPVSICYITCYHLLLPAITCYNLTAWCTCCIVYAMLLIDKEAATLEEQVYNRLRISNPHRQQVPNMPKKYFNCKFKTEKLSKLVCSLILLENLLCS